MAQSIFRIDHARAKIHGREKLPKIGFFGSGHRRDHHEMGLRSRIKCGKLRRSSRHSYLSAIRAIRAKFRLPIETTDRRTRVD
jgi:hypothetical protein